MIKSVPLSVSESGIPGPGSDPHIYLPIEGRTKWPFIMRVMAFGSAVTVMVLAIIYTLLLAPTGSTFRPEIIFVGLFLLLLCELMTMRYLIIPMRGNYGRFRIGKNRVDLYPLSRYGFTVLPEPESAPITDYKGVSLAVGDGHQGMYYNVFLTHAKRSKTICIRSFATKAQAGTFARTLADTLGLNYIPPE